MFQKGKPLRLSSKDSLMYNHRERSFYENKRLNLSQRVGEMLTLFSSSTTHHSDRRTCSIKRSETHTTAAWHSICSAHHDEQADAKAKSRAKLPEAKATFPDRQAFRRNARKDINRLQTNKFHPDSVDFISKVFEPDQVQRFLGPL